MYAVVDNDTIKFEILPPSDSRKALLCFKKATRQKAFKAFFTSQKTSCRWQITSAFACCWLRWAWVAYLAAVRAGGCKRGAFRAVAYVRCWGDHRKTVVSEVLSVPLPIRVYAVELFFCMVFGKNFNIMSALLVNQLPTLPQIIDSREGWFWCK